MDVSIYFEKIGIEKIIDKEHIHPNQLLNFIGINTEESGFPELADIDIALIGVNEGRVSINNS